MTCVSLAQDIHRLAHGFCGQTDMAGPAADSPGMQTAGAIVGVRAATRLLPSGMADAVAEVLLF